MSQIITNINDLDFKPNTLPAMPVPCQVLLVAPTHFDVEYVINPHMKDQVGAVDKMQAQNEWEHLRNFYDELGLQVHVLNGHDGLPDMVFCANQSLPDIDENGACRVVMSNMHAGQRKPEVAPVEAFYREQGYEVLHLNSDDELSFEGMGDAIWHFKRRLLWGGYGFRTSKEVYRQISDLLDVPIILLELVDDRYYHLDTCFCMLNEHSVLIYPDAFTKEGRELIYAMFDTVIEATSYEAEKLFAVNAVCPDGKNVMIQQGCTDVNQKLHDAGFSVHEFSTFEFIKSGGSVFCMKMLFW
ncbi:MAG: dimethylarginine dimethylaminohydrolase family protein [Balneolaceae bacterium]